MLESYTVLKIIAESISSVAEMKTDTETMRIGIG